MSALKKKHSLLLCLALLQRATWSLFRPEVLRMGVGRKKARASPKNTFGSVGADMERRRSVDLPNRIFFTNVRYDVQDEEVEAFFKTVGPVKQCKIIKDSRTGQSKGWGFVTFGHSLHATVALRTLHGLPIANRPIKLGEATSLARRRKERRATEAFEKREARRAKEKKEAAERRATKKSGLNVGKRNDDYVEDSVVADVSREPVGFQGATEAATKEVILEKDAPFDDDDDDFESIEWAGGATEEPWDTATVNKYLASHNLEVAPPSSDDDDDDDDDDEDEAPKKKKRKAEEEEEVEEVPIDDDELKEMQADNIVPRAKRRAAVNSGLGAPAKTSSKKTVDDDDEQEFV